MKVKKTEPNTHLCQGVWLPLKALSPWMIHLSTWRVLYTGLDYSLRLLSQKSPLLGGH